GGTSRRTGGRSWSLRTWVYPGVGKGGGGAAPRGGYRRSVPPRWTQPTQRSPAGSSPSGPRATTGDPHMPRTAFLGTGFHVPSRVVTNHDLAALMDTSDEWIQERTGIVQRHWVSPGETGAAM